MLLTFLKYCSDMLFDSGFSFKAEEETIMAIKFLKNFSLTKALISHGIPYEA